jgi:Transglycosylase SLT domain
VLNNLIAGRPEVVRLLPSGLNRMTSSSHESSPVRPTHRDFRVICDCQRHALRERTIARRTMRGIRIIGGHLQRRTVALIVGLPLAFGAIGIPMEAMDVSIPILSSITGGSRATPVAADLPIFTTRKVRDTFLHPENAPHELSLALTKERYFRSVVPYGEIIYREGLRHNLAPELVAAIVEAESDFRVGLVSHKNAQGLMQIVPETSRLLGCRNPFNAEQNIAAGTKYLRYLLDRFGDERVALAAYNAGEGNVERFGGIPPFPETQDYLRKVSARTKIYRQRVNNRYLAALKMTAPATH